MKRHRWLLIGMVLVFFSLACQSIPFLAHPTATPTTTPTPTRTSTPTKTHTPTGVPGVTVPVMVEGIKIQFTSLHKESEVVFGSKSYRPSSSSDVFIVAEADVLSTGTAHSEVADWDVRMNTSNKWSFMRSHGNSNSITSVEWVFVMSKTTTNFQINLPGGVDIVLTSLL